MFSEEYFKINPISCANCLHDITIKNDIHFCIEKNITIPIGEDIGSQTNCANWEVSRKIDDFQKIAGGSKANFSGKSAEQVIGYFLEMKGYKVRYNYVLPCQGIWGNDLRVDVLCQGIPKFNNGLIIESKWQDSSGSAFQKIPYAIENIKSSYPTDTILIIDRKWMKKGIGKNAFEWSKTQIGGKLIKVFSLTEFMSWIIEQY